MQIVFVSHPSRIIIYCYYYPTIIRLPYFTENIKDPDFRQKDLRDPDFRQKDLGGPDFRQKDMKDPDLSHTNERTINEWVTEGDQTKISLDDMKWRR